MPKKKTITSTEIKSLIKTKKIIIGSERTIKNLKLGKVEKVLISSNCSESMINNLTYYAKLSNTEVIKLDYTNEEIGVICKKPFSISVLSILKGV